MKPSQLKQYLTFAFTHKLPVLVKGSPGIGKTDIIKEVTDAMSYDLLISHPVVNDPTDYKGFPFPVDNKTAEFLPFGDLKRLISAKKPLIYFIDDLGQASPSVQAACMQLLLARRINDHKVSDFVTFIAATNRKEDKAGVSGILEPVKSRFKTIIELDVDVDEWVKWAFANGMPIELIAFIKLRNDFITKFEPTKDIVNSGCPRTIASVGKQQSLGLAQELEREVFTGAAGETFSTEYCAFLEFYRDLPSIDDIIKNPTSVSIPTNPSHLYAVTAALGNKMTTGNIDKIMQFLTRIGPDVAVTTLLIAQDKDKTKKICKTKSFIEFATKNKALFI